MYIQPWSRTCTSSYHLNGAPSYQGCHILPLDSPPNLLQCYRILATDLMQFRQMDKLRAATEIGTLLRTPYRYQTTSAVNCSHGLS